MKFEFGEIVCRLPPLTFPLVIAERVPENGAADAAAVAARRPSSRALHFMRVFFALIISMHAQFSRSIQLRCHSE